MKMKSKDPVRVFVGQDSGPEGYVAFFEDTVGDAETPPGGYLYVKDCERQKIRHLEIYSRPLKINESDVRIFWSSDGRKCGVSIWNRMRGVMDVVNGQQISLAVESRESPAVTDPEWLNGFEDYLDEDRLIRARQRYWKEVVKSYDQNVEVLPEDNLILATNFVLYTMGPDNLFAVFEDDGRTGYLYLFSASVQTIVAHLLIYDRSTKVSVAPQDVRVAWSADGNKCAVVIWGKMRGIIDRVKKQEGRVKLEDRETPGIGDAEWLSGFEYLWNR